MSEKLEVKQALREAIDNKKTSRVRSFLDNNLLWFANDYNFLQECYQIAKKYSFIFDEHDNQKLDYNKRNWTKEYYYKVSGELLSNYSKERYEFLMELAFYLSGEKDSVVMPNSTEQTIAKSSKVEQPTIAKSNVKVVVEKKTSNNMNWLILLGGVGILIMLGLIMKKMMS